ncbi:MAG: response regulator [Deltaproteobacteria bacterium]|nr:response regulator [Deltaproteobacteria bacterium]
MEHTVLLVDDERNILNSLERALRRDGYRILTAENGADGLVQIKGNRVALVISDHRMPGMDGVEFLSKVKAASPETVRFMLTGCADLKDVMAAINRGEVARYITKPWNDDELKAAAKEAVERFNLVDENRRLEEVTRQQNAALKDLNANLEKKVEEKTKKIRDNFFSFVKIFSNMMELYDHNVGGRSRRVAAMAKRLSARMGLDGVDGELIETAALLHNIGLIGLPREMIDRDEELLTTDERALLVHFPKVSQDLLSTVDTLRQAGVIIRGCMERFDGKGWPDGLKGGEIHIGSQIIAISSFYDRYRHGPRKLTHKDIVVKIMEEKGRAFDPVVADEFFGFLAGWVEDERAFDSDADGPEVRRHHIANIRPGMVLAENLGTTKGRLLVTKGTVMTEALIERVLKYHQIEPVADCACLSKPAVRA